MSFAQVLFDNAGSRSTPADTTYDYRIPEDLEGLVMPSMRVIVPFGKNNRPQSAYVVRTSETCAYDETKVKSIIRLVDTEPVIPGYLADTALFLRDNYFCTFAEAVRCVLPSQEKLVKRITYTVTDKTLCEKELSKEELEIYTVIAGKKTSAAVSYLKGKTSFDQAQLLGYLASLSKKGYTAVEEEFEFENREKTEEFLLLADDENPLEDYLMIIGSRAKKQREIMEYIYSRKPEPVSKKEVMTNTGCNSASINALIEMQLIEKQMFGISRGIDLSEKGSKEGLPELNEEQAACVDRFSQGKAGEKYLLFGVTGSGKTRVFFEFFDRILSEGKQCLFLVPEISLTPQMMKLVRSRFGSIVAVMHSKLTPAERYTEFLKIKRGAARIVLGARSALFMPFSDLGLIVIDEEHETSYKSSQSPRYDTVEVAEYICDKTGASLVLASATPSIRSFMRAQTGELTLLRLDKRANNIPMPIISVTDMRGELRSGNRSPISRALMEKMEQRLADHEQILLFLNRRGYNTYVFCRSCGHIEMCPNCEVSLTYHYKDDSLTCHYCGYKKKTPKKCPECGSEKIKFMGSGTEKIEAAVKDMFPLARVLRLDSDVATTKSRYTQILSDFAEGRADILIGTQMIVKGLDFDNVTLVGIVLADAALTFPDINASARTFQLTAQAAGRAGRRDKRGEVILQTYKPDNQTLVYCSQHDYEGFYSYEIEFRQKMDYPPFTEIFGIFTADEDLSRCISDAKTIYERIDAIIEEYGDNGVKLYDPAPAFIQKLKNKYLYHVLVRYEKGSDFKYELRRRYSDIKSGIKSYVYTEIDPVTLL